MGRGPGGGGDPARSVVEAMMVWGRTWGERKRDRYPDSSRTGVATLTVVLEDVDDLEVRSDY